MGYSEPLQFLVSKISKIMNARVAMIIGPSILLLGTSLGGLERSQSLILQGQSEQSGLSPQELFHRVSPTVVVVETLDGQGRRQSQGSGVIIAPSIVVTNKHVIIDGETTRVRRGQESWEASIAAVDPDADLCLLLVIGLQAPDINTRESSSLQIGERVFAIGAPEGFELSLSDGLVSGIRKRGETSVIQTTAAISPGSSGGGLFDEKGNLVGITTFFVEDAQALNFALPANLALALATQSTERTALAWLRLGDRIVAEANRRLSQGGEFLDPPDIRDRRAWEALGKKAEESMAMYRADLRKAIRPYRECLKLKPTRETLRCGPSDFECLNLSPADLSKPMDVMAWVRLGSLFAKMDDYENSLSAFREAQRLRAEDAWVWQQFAKALVSLRDFKNAANAYREALRLRPSASGWIDFASSMLSNDRDEALAALQEASRLNPSEGELCLIGKTYSHLGKQKEALAPLQAAVRLRPDDGACLLDLGVVYVRMKKKREAKEIYQRLRIIDPRRAELLRHYM